MMKKVAIALSVVPLVLALAQADPPATQPSTLAAERAEMLKADVKSRRKSLQLPRLLNLSSKRLRERSGIHVRAAGGRLVGRAGFRKRGCPAAL